MPPTQAPCTREDILTAMEIGATRVPRRWETILAQVLSSVTDRENILMGGAAPQVVERTGYNRRDKFIDKVWTIHNVTYDAIHRMKREHYLDDRVGRALQIARQLGVRIAAHPSKLISALVDNGKSGVGYDGAAFYADSHQHVNETAYDNLLGGSGVDTLAHVQTDLWAAVAYFMAVTDDKGEPVFEPEEDLTFIIHAPPVLERFLREASSADFLGSTSNVLKGLRKFDYWFDGRLTDANDWCVHAVAPDKKPFIFLEREAPQDVFFGPDDAEVKEGSRPVTYGKVVRYAAAYGDPRCSCRVVNA
jgi:phage major head subunit gpT-like protein